MAVHEEVIEADCKLIVRVTGAGFAEADGRDQIFADLDAGLTILEREMANSDHYFFQICLDVDGVAPAVGAFDPYDYAGDEAEPNEPWCSFCPAFWTRALQDPAGRAKVLSFINRFYEVLAKAAQTASSPPSEFDEVQLGEPLIAHLAMTDLALVPTFQRFVKIWDMDHEVEISAAVDAILEQHGLVAETEALLTYCLLEPFAGQDTEHMLLSRFQNIHPGAAETVLFQRYVVLNYRNHLMAQAEDCRVYQSRLRSKKPDEDPVALAERIYRFGFAEASAFGRAERQIVAEIQAQQIAGHTPPTQPPGKGASITRLFRR